MLSKREIYFVLIAICCIIYANAVKAAFVSDDVPTIVNNPLISKPLEYWDNPHALIKCLDFFVSGLNPWAYHLTGIILYCINTTLIFIFMLLFFDIEASFFAACLFAVHPIHTEVVTWISGQTYLVSTLGFLVIYFLYLRAMKFRAGNRKSWVFWYVISLAIFSYFLLKIFYIILFLPLFIMLYDFLFTKWRKNLLWWIPFVSLELIWLILAKATINHRITSVAAEISGQPHFNNPALYFIYSVASHLWLLIWPQSLTIYHEPVLISPALQKFYPIYLLIILVVVLKAFKTDKRLFWAVIVFILFLAPTYSHIPIASVVADRYAYLSSIGFCLALAYFYERFMPKQTEAKKYAVAVLIFILSLYGVRTIVRNEDYHSSQMFWQETLAVSPDSPRAHNNVGVSYVEEGNIAKATAEFKEAIRMRPGYSDAMYNLFITQVDVGDKRQALASLLEETKAKPYSPDAFLKLANLYIALNNKRDAVSCLKKAIELAPQSVEAYNDLGNIYVGMDNYKEALIYYQKAIEINPKYANAYYNLGNLYNKLGNKEEAVSYYDKTIKIDPRYTYAYNNLGNIYNELNQKEKAIDTLVRGIASNPDSPVMCNTLGGLYISMGKVKDAIPLLNRAVKIDPNYAPAYYNLSAAYFYEKNYNLAIRHCDEALRLGFNIPQSFLNELKPYRSK